MNTADPLFLLIQHHILHFLCHSLCRSAITVLWCSDARSPAKGVFEKRTTHLNLSHSITLLPGYLIIYQLLEIDLPKSDDNEIILRITALFKTTSCKKMAAFQLIKLFFFKNI